jgi:hypothetical protein
LRQIAVLPFGHRQRLFPTPYSKIAHILQHRTISVNILKLTFAYNSSMLFDFCGIVFTMRIAIIGWGIEGKSAFEYFGPEHEYLIASEQPLADFPEESDKIKVQHLSAEKPAGITSMVSKTATKSYSPQHPVKT